MGRRGGRRRACGPGGGEPGRGAGPAPLVLEQGDEDAYLCNSRVSPWAFFQIALHDIASGAAALRQAIDRATRSYVAPALADRFASGAGPAIRWLQAQGVAPRAGAAIRRKRAAQRRRCRGSRGSIGQAAPATSCFAALPTRSGARRRAAARLARARVDHASRPLHRRGRRQRGPVTQSFAARAVVIADGGFQANPDLVRASCQPGPDRLFTATPGTGAATGC